MIQPHEITTGGDQMTPEEPYCSHCGEEKNLAYIEQYANGEEWRCKECGQTFMFNRPKEDEYTESPKPITSEEITHIPHDGKRVETGAVQFGDDWPGVFIRGDNASAYAMDLRRVLEHIPDECMFTRASIGGLINTLESCKQ